jgi:hypothetical protein
MTQATLFDLAPYTVKVQAPPDEPPALKHEQLDWHQEDALHSLYCNYGIGYRDLCEWNRYFDFNDWIELHLRGFIAVDLNGVKTVSELGKEYLAERDLL